MSPLHNENATSCVEWPRWQSLSHNGGGLADSDVRWYHSRSLPSFIYS